MYHYTLVTADGKTLDHGEVFDGKAYIGHLISFGWEAVYADDVMTVLIRPIPANNHVVIVLSEPEVSRPTEPAHLHHSHP